MKKLFFSYCIVLSVPVTVNAQLTLTGTPYTENFDNIGTSGLPVGWECYKAATATSLGTMESFNGAASNGIFYDTINCPTEVFKHGFKNCPSADVVSPTAACAQQPSIANRAFAVRQAGSTHPGYDPGVAFVLHLANTSGRTRFAMSFKLQSLDITSHRATTWQIDYGFGASPTVFTAVPSTGYLVTGNNIFSDTLITVSFGSALDNQNQDVWIRIVTLTHTTGGSGHRTTTAIDDFTLSYTSAVSVNSFNAQVPLDFLTLGDAKPDKITFAYKIGKPGQYNLGIYDMKGSLVYEKRLDLVQDSQNRIIITDMNLAPGMYIAKFGNDNTQRDIKLIIQ